MGLIILEFAWKEDFRRQFSVAHRCDHEVAFRAIENTIFGHSDRSVSGLLLEHYVTTLIYSPLCISFTKIFAKNIAYGEYLNTGNAIEHLIR